MKKLFAVLLSALLLCGIMTPAFAAEEIPDGYMPICTAEDLNSIRNNLDGKYILMNDIDLSSVGNWTPIGKETAPFSGILIGNNHTIQNLTITVTQEQPASLAGLFGCIKDAYLAGFALDQISLSIENPIYETIAAGGIAALGISGAISNCSVSGTIRAVGGRGLFIGGLVGWGLSPLVPSAQALEIINCKNASNLTVIGKLEQEPPFDYGDNYIFNHTYVGGLVGCHENAILRQCSNSGSIEVQALYDACIGGVAGVAAEVENSLNCGNLTCSIVNGDGALGGLVGEASTLSACVNTVSLAKDNDIVAGNMLGRNPNQIKVIISNCFSITGLEAVGNLSVTAKEISVILLSKDQLATQNNYGSLDFESIWRMSENYPIPDQQAVFPEFVEIHVGETYSLAMPLIYVGNNDTTIVDIISDTDLLARSEGTSSFLVVTADGVCRTLTVQITQIPRLSLWARIYRFFEHLIQKFLAVFNRKGV